MKALLKSLIVFVLGWQVRRLYKNNSQLRVVGVSGSVGKTSTKLAIAKILSQKYKVQYQDGNYNDLLTVPLVFFGHKTPSLFNPISWLILVLANEIKLLKKYPYDVVVLELGTDGPGQIQKFNKYLKLEIGVLTAITPEHMEYFEDLDAVAEEEGQIFKLSTLTLLNKDMVDPKYIIANNSLTYAINIDADYKLSNLAFNNDGCSFDVYAGAEKIFSGHHEAIAEPLMYAILAGISVAKKFELDDLQIEHGIKSIKPAPGRMQILDGIKGSKIIDDTYNASPEAVKAALKTLYRINAKQKIALLGNMNELGKYSEDEHKSIGKICDPKQLHLIVTIGPDANKYLAPEAQHNGCSVQQFDNPYDAGKFIKDKIEDDAVILVKGSQNGVYAEEAIKEILADASDINRLVRQNNYWLKRKAKSFQ